MNWENIQYFDRYSFAEDGNLAEPELIRSLDHGRYLMKERTYPSPVVGTLARYGGSKKSQHYVGESPQTIIRKSTGVDVFCEGIPFHNFMVLCQSGLFNGIGVYVDTNGIDGKPWVMFHLDIRKTGFEDNPLIWFGVKEKGITKYRYPQVNSRYWSLFQRSNLYTPKYK